MGRYATPLITAPPLPPVDNGVEVLLCEARLAHRATNDPDDFEEEQLMTVLLSFDPSPAQRYAARNLVGTYISAQSTVEQLPVGSDLADWLLGMLKSRVAASLYVVLALPLVYSKETARQIEAVLGGLRNDRYHQLGLAVAVGERPGDWGDCNGIDGFVASGAGDGDRASIQVFNMLASLMAPGLTSCVDWDELRSVFGTYEFPSKMMSGVWLERQATFIWDSVEDQRLVKNCRAVASMPTRCLQLTSQHKMLKEICKSTEDDLELVMIAPYGMSSESYLTDQIIPILLIAAPFAERMITS